MPDRPGRNHPPPTVLATQTGPVAPKKVRAREHATRQGCCRGMDQWRRPSDRLHLEALGAWATYHPSQLSGRIASCEIGAHTGRAIMRTSGLFRGIVSHNDPPIKA